MGRRPSLQLETVRRQIVGRSIMLILPEARLEMIDREVAELLERFLKINRPTSQQLYRANELLRGGNRAGAQNILREAIEANRRAQPLKARRPSRSSFAAHLIELGAAAYLAEKKKPNNAADAAASPPPVRPNGNAAATKSANR